MKTAAELPIPLKPTLEPTDHKAMTAPNPADAYLRSKVLSARPEELRLMLIEGAIKFARQGGEGIASKNWELAYNGLSRTKNILLELISSLRPEIAPEICEKLSSLYMYMYRRLIDANLEKSAKIVDEVVDLLEYDRETWLMVIEKYREENGLPPMRREDANALAQAINDASPPDVDAEPIQQAAAQPVKPSIRPAAPKQLPASAGGAGAKNPGYSPISIEG
jgi:flagellar protein FliS